MTTPVVQGVSPAAPRPRRRRVDPVRYGILNPSELNLLTQVRGTYDPEYIEGLAESFRAVGIMQAPAVAELDRDHVGPYLAYFNEAFGSAHRVDELLTVLDRGDVLYRIAIYGHCRVLAGRLVWRPQADSDRPPLHVVHHPLLHPRGMEMKVLRNIDPALAYEMQLAENTARPPTRTQVAERIRDSWRMHLGRNPRLTKREFAAICNMSLDFVLESLRFCDLPEEVRRVVEQGSFPFGAAVQLTRLQRAGFRDDEVVRKMQWLIANGKRAADTPRLITAAIKARQDTEPPAILGDLEDDGFSAALQQSVDRLTLQTLGTEAAALGRALRAAEDGLLPVASPLQDSSIRQVVRRGDQVRSDLARL